MNTIAKSLVVVAGLITTGAWAEEGPWYIAVTGGNATYKGVADSAHGVPDATELSSGISAGYRFNPNVALELGYLSFGDVEARNNYSPMDLHPCNNFASLCTNREVRSASAKSTHVSLVLSAPVWDSFSVYGRLGAARTQRKLTTDTDLSKVTDSTTKTEGLFGIGVTYAATPNIQATLEWQRLNDTKVDYVALGLRLSF